MRSRVVGFEPYDTKEDVSNCKMTSGEISRRRTSALQQGGAVLF